MSYSDPVLVVGTGRCGTSIVAAQLDYLGCHMGNNLVPADENNPGGHWEDQDFKNLHQAHLNEEMGVEEFVQQAKQMVYHRGIRNRHWGWKLPSTAQVIGHYLETIFQGGESIIWCKRPMEDCIRSCVEAYGWDKETATQLIQVRWHGLHKYLDEYLSRCEKCGSFLGTGDSTCGNCGYEDPRTLIELEFNQIVGDPEGTVRMLNDRLDLRAYDDQIERAVDYVVQDRPGPDTKVLVCSWHMGNVRHEIAQFLRALENDERYEIDIVHPSAVPYESNVAKTIREKFLAEDYDYMLFVDDDNPPQKNPLDLVELDKDIIGLPTPTIQNGNLFFVTMEKCGGMFTPAPHSKRRSLAEVDAVGSGSMLVARRVFDQMDAPFRLMWDEDGVSIRSGDFNFCTRAREVGFKVWAHYNYICDHIKETGLLSVLDMYKNNEKLNVG